MAKLDKKMDSSTLESMLHDVNELGAVEIDDKCPCKNRQCTLLAGETSPPGRAYFGTPPFQFSAHLSKSDVNKNSNKYYILQLH